MKRKLLSLLLAVLMIISALPTVIMAEDSTDLPFTDVDSSNWFYGAVVSVYENKIMKGITETEFSPNGNVTRAELVMILFRLAEVPTPSGYNVDFSDVEEGAWYYDALMWASTVTGIIRGYSDGTFRPNAPVTRAEMAAMLNRYFDLVGMKFAEKPARDSFTDADSIPSWAAEDIEAMRLSGIFAGDENGRCTPDNSATRAEAATMIMRFMDFNKFAVGLILNGISIINYSFKDVLDETDLTAKVKEKSDPTGLAETVKFDDFAALAKDINNIEYAVIARRFVPVIYRKGEFTVVRTLEFMFQKFVELKPDGSATEFSYSAAANENDIITAINTFSENNDYYSVSIKDYAALAERLAAIAPGESAAVDVTAVFVRGNDTQERTYSVTFKNTATLTPAGESTAYSFETSVNATELLSALKAFADPDNCYDGVSIKNYAALEEEISAIVGGSSKALDVTVIFEKGAVTVERTYSVTFTNTAEAPVVDDRPDADSVGILYEDAATGLKISKAKLIAGSDGIGILGESGIGTHGAHENKILRTDTGVYAVYVVDVYDKPDGYTDASDIFHVVKITNDGAKILMTSECPRAWGSCLPNIMAGRDGSIYVSVLANLYEVAWLNMFKIDERTEQVVSGADGENHHEIPFKIRGGTTHGYGYSMPILDLESGKIYGFYNAGDIPGYIAWFIYDMDTDTWDTTCHSVEIEYRLGYICAYPDGNGGFRFFGQRDVFGAAKSGYIGLNNHLGVADIVKSNAGYVFDAIYYFHVPDATKDECTYQTLYEPDYRAIYAAKVKANPRIQTISYVGASYYGEGGVTYRDLGGNVHIIYTKTEDSSKNHAIYDKDGNKIFDEKLTLSGGKKDSYTFAMAQGKSGKYYILVWNTTGSSKMKYANLEILSSDDGKTFKSEVATMEVLTTEGSFTEKNPFGTKLVMASPRNGSVADGTLNLLLFQSSDRITEHGETASNYYYMTVELP